MSVDRGPARERGDPAVATRFRQVFLLQEVAPLAEACIVDQEIDRLSRERAAMTKWAPCEASSSANDLPVPDEAPVINAVMP